MIHVVTVADLRPAAAVAHDDGRALQGEFLRSAKLVNTMIQQLGVFTAEVTRVCAPEADDAEEPDAVGAGALSNPGKISGRPLRLDDERLSVGVG